MPYKAPSHRPAGYRTEQQRQKEFDSTRGTATARGYTYTWRKAREVYLSQHPLCVMCKVAGIVKEAKHVDHIVAHKGNTKLFWDKSNWQALCASCHSRKTAKEDSSFARRKG